MSSSPCVNAVAATTTQSPGLERRGLLCLSGSVAAAAGQSGWVWRQRRVKMGGQDAADLLPWWSPGVMLPPEDSQRHHARDLLRDPHPDPQTRRERKVLRRQRTHKERRRHATGEEPCQDGWWAWLEPGWMAQAVGAMWRWSVTAGVVVLTRLLGVIWRGVSGREEPWAASLGWSNERDSNEYETGEAFSVSATRASAGPRCSPRGTPPPATPHQPPSRSLDLSQLVPPSSPAAPSPPGSPGAHRVPRSSMIHPRSEPMVAPRCDQPEDPHDPNSLRVGACNPFLQAVQGFSSMQDEMMRAIREAKETSSAMLLERRDSLSSSASVGSLKSLDTSINGCQQGSCVSSVISSVVSSTSPSPSREPQPPSPLLLTTDTLEEDYDQNLEDDIESSLADLDLDQQHSDTDTEVENLSQLSSSCPEITVRSTLVLDLTRRQWSPDDNFPKATTSVVLHAEDVPSPPCHAVDPKVQSESEEVIRAIVNLAKDSVNEDKLAAPSPSPRTPRHHEQCAPRQDPTSGAAPHGAVLIGVVSGKTSQPEAWAEGQRAQNSETATLQPDIHPSQERSHKGAEGSTLLAVESCGLDQDRKTSTVTRDQLHLHEGTHMPHHPRLEHTPQASTSSPPLSVHTPPSLLPSLSSPPLSTSPPPWPPSSPESLRKQQGQEQEPASISPLPGVGGKAGKAEAAGGLDAALDITALKNEISAIKAEILSRKGKKSQAEKAAAPERCIVSSCEDLTHLRDEILSLKQDFYSLLHENSVTMQEAAAHPPAVHHRLGGPHLKHQLKSVSIDNVDELKKGPGKGGEGPAFLRQRGKGARGGGAGGFTVSMVLDLADDPAAAAATTARRPASQVLVSPPISPRSYQGGGGGGGQLAAVQELAALHPALATRPPPAPRHHTLSKAKTTATALLLPGLLTGRGAGQGGGEAGGSGSEGDSDGGSCDSDEIVSVTRFTSVERILYGIDPSPYKFRRRSVLPAHQQRRRRERERERERERMHAFPCGFLVVNGG